MEFGQSETLSWDRGLALVQEADSLWRTTLVVRDGQIPKYKFLVSDCTWSNGTDYRSKVGKSQIHIPSFGSHSSSLIAPINVGIGNKLALYGKGHVKINQEPVELNWEKGVDFVNLGPSLWVLPVIATSDVEFKICLVKGSGEVVWERAANRNLLTGQEVILLSDFGPGLCKVEDMGIATATLGTHLLNRQGSLINKRYEEAKQIQSQVKVRPLPCLIKGVAKSFSDTAIIKVNPFVKIEEKNIDGIVFQLLSTRNGRTILIQEAPEGCTAGVSAMLINDNNGILKAADLLNRKAASDKQIAKDIRNAGLLPRITPVAELKRSMVNLRKLISVDGPAYVAINQNSDDVAHAILVDEISEDGSEVLIRDPWHGWECVVKGDAFQQAWENYLNEDEVGYIVQVQNGKK
jgi:hypothetical protein